MAAKFSEKCCPRCGVQWDTEEKLYNCDALGHTGIAARGDRVVNSAGLPSGWRPSK